MVAVSEREVSVCTLKVVFFLGHRLLGFFSMGLSRFALLVVAHFPLSEGLDPLVFDRLDWVQGIVN
ncbi:hypothetical protein AALP_AA4G104400 [Arabis alpina]|uniref:Uncharacterized protein n=1 Tax=Arabis alpina TaxID=50452 RepID=A0A087H2E8_ARAAL|nr:hypothetical protein AALP_AA4G104400 [Arabis alpina]